MPRDRRIRPRTPLPRSPRPWLLAAPALFVMAWGGNHFTPLLALYENAEHYSVAAVDLFLGLYVIGMIPGLLLAGALSDRYGRKPVVLAGVLSGIAASAILGPGSASTAAMCAGRLLAGLGVGIAMSVGTSWVAELSAPPFDRSADAVAAARRPSLALTLGFALGAGVAGALAQWGPAPTLSPYAAHILVSLVALAALARAPETRERRPATQSLAADLRVPLVGHRRFVRVVLPVAPWVFGAAGLAYAVMPQLVQSRLGDLSLAYATLLTVLTLGCGALVQPLVGRLNALTRGHALVVGMSIMLAGTLLAVAGAIGRSPAVALGAAITLGVAYGICVVAGLIEIQRIARPDDLAGITGVYYSLSYLGFLLPLVLACFSALAGYAVLLTVVAGVCLASLVAVTAGLRFSSAE